MLINANENPMGPCSAACDAIAKAGIAGGRYDFARTNQLVKIFQLQEQQGLKPNYMAVYAGSTGAVAFYCARVYISRRAAM